MRALLCSFALLLVVSPLTACQKEGPPPTPPTAGGTVVPPAVGEGGGSTATPAAGGSDALACQSDADCVVSCARANECCDQLCPPCAQVFNKASLEALMTWRKDSCADKSCPMAKCMAPKEDTVAHCTSGQCTIERVPAKNE
jgi:predicted small lipoprotein YifL